MGGDLVTGEAVLLELRLAKLPSRAVAKILDLLVLLAMVLFFAATGSVSGLSDSLDGAAGAALRLVVIIGLLVGYPVLFETLSRGRSLGKMAMGLRVVRDDGGPIHFRHAMVRGLLAVFEVYITFGVVAIITSLVSVQGKRVGDYLAGTVVVRERVPNVAAPMIVMPPPLATWAATLELSRLPDHLALSARQFLSRARDLSADVRHSMGNRIAYEVSQHVAPTPPPGCPPEAYLAAVLAERRRREEVRYGAPAATAAPQYPAQPYAAPPGAAPYATDPYATDPYAPPQPPGPPPPAPSPDGFAAPS